MTMDTVHCGFIRLTDSANLVAALEMGFAAEQGIDLVLHRETSWSNIRDKVSLGIYPMAHMLAPMSLASNLGFGAHSTPVDVPFLLSMNGNTLSASPEFATQIREHGGSFDSAVDTGKALVALSRKNRLRVGVPFLHSQHLVLMNYLFRESGGSPRDITFSIAPPPLLQDVLRAGEIDVVVVGEPWGSAAVQAGTAEILLPTAAIWSGSPEKVLGIRRDWMEENEEITKRLIAALYKSASWASSAVATKTLSEILALPRYVDAPSETIEHILRGQFILNADGDIGNHAHAIRLGGNNTNFPWNSAAHWIGDQVAPLWGLSSSQARHAAARSFRSDLYHETLASKGIPLPESPFKTEGLIKEPELVDTDSGQLVLGPDSFFNGTTYEPSA